MIETANVTLAAAVDKWRDRWPEWEVAEIFVPATQRARAAAWFAWLDALAAAAWSGSDAAPGMAKLAWWQEELRGWSKGARRHPLGIALQPMPVAWADIADQMGALGLRDFGINGAIEPLSKSLAPFAREIARAEQHVLDDASAATPERVVRTLLVSAGVIPDSGLGQGHANGPTARRLLDAVADLRATSSKRRPSRFKLLLTLWRAARSG